MTDTFQFRRDIRLLGRTTTCRENYRLRCLILIVFMTMIFSLTHPTASALAESDSSVPVDSVDFLTASMENALTSERARLADLKERVRRFEKQLEEIKVNISIYETQNTAHENLFLISQIDSEDIEKALLSNRLTIKALEQ